MSRFSQLICCTLFATAALAQDATQTDPDKYKVLFENACVRLLEYRDLPGQKTHEHRHPAFALVALEPFKRTLTLPDGKVLTREFKRGDAFYSDAQTHIGTNVGQTPTHVVIVELKRGVGADGKCG